MCLVKVKPSSAQEEDIAIPPRPVRQHQHQHQHQQQQQQQAIPQYRQQTQRPSSSHPSLRRASVPVQYIEAIPAATSLAPPSSQPHYGIQPQQPSQQNRIIQQISPHSSIITVHTSREYIPQQSPRNSVRFVDAVGTNGQLGGATAMRRGSSADKRFYVDEGRRSGSLTYATNPRHSTASHRSARERVVTIDAQGRRREYYR